MNTQTTYSKLDQFELNDLISLCKTEFSKLIQEEASKQKKKLEYMKLIEILQNMNSIELARNSSNVATEPSGKNRFSCVTKREDKLAERVELSQFNHQLNFTDDVWNEFNNIEQMSELFMLRVSSSEDDAQREQVQAAHQRSLRRSLAKINLKKNGANNKTTLGESILSTAETYLTNKLTINVKKQMKLKPKSTSSTTSLAAAGATDKSMTFNVDFASTPKKIAPKVSTPRGVQTLKRIPPPLLSSSVLINPNAAAQQQKRKLRTKSISDQEEDKLNDVHKLKHHKRDNNERYKCKCCASCCKKCLKQQRKAASVKSDCCVYDEETNRLVTRLKKVKKANVRYPIKFLPHTRTQDIDRINSVDDQGLVCCDLKPFLKTCYSYGDYNVWLL